MHLGQSVPFWLHSGTQEIRSLTNNITTVGNSLVNTTCVYQTSLQNITDFVSRLGSTCDNVPACAMALCALRNSTNKIPDVSNNYNTNYSYSYIP